MGLPSLTEFVDGIREEVVDFAKNPQNAVVDLVTGFDRDEEARVRDEQAAGNAARSDLYARQAGLYGTAAGFDDPVLTSPEAFEAMSHEEIKAAVDAMNGETLTASAEGWKKIGESIEQSLNDFRDFISGTIAGNWEGVAADRAEQATAKYADDSAQLANAGKLVGSKIEEAATGVNQVKATVPPVTERSLLERAFDAVAPTAGVLKSILHQQDEAHQEAIQIMRTVYTPVMQQADTMVPRLPAPPQVAGGPGPSAPQGFGAPSSGSPTSYTPFTTPGTGTTGAPVPTGGAPGPGTFADDGAYAGPNPAGPDPAGTDPYATTPDTAAAQAGPADAWTAPAAVNPEDGTRLGQSGLGSGATAGATPGNPGNLGGAGVGGGAGLGGAGSAAGAGGSAPGGFVGGGLGANGSTPGGGASSGTSATTAAGAPAGSATAATTGRSTPGAAGMMPGAGARGRGDGDNEHKTPGYLVNVDNGSELVGRLPLAAPPVIGT